MLTAGVKGKKEIIVTEDLTAARFGSGLIDVYATPALIGLAEGTAAESVQPMLDEGMTTVGTLVNIAHLAATPVGMKVTVETELTEVDRRRLVFAVNAFDEAGIIAQGSHERFIVDKAKFQQKADAKGQRQPGV